MDGRVLRYLPVPVPQIDGVWLRWGTYWHKSNETKYCVVMRRAKGVPLAEVWDQMSVINQEQVVSTLRKYIKAMREIEQPAALEGLICSFTGGAMQDEGLTSFEPVGPFTPSGFVEYLLDTWYEDKQAREKANYRDQLSNPKLITPVLTHGDLHPYNIVVDKDKRTREYKITGIIDWTTSGWLPMYWEAYKARPTHPGCWDKVVERFAGDFKEEIAVLDKLRRVLR